MMSDLPDGWTRLTLNDVGEITTGNTPLTKQKENYGGNIPFVKPGDLDKPFPITQTEQTLSENGAKQARLLRPGAILVSCIGNLGKIGIAGVPLATNQQINSIEFNQSIVNDRYAYQYCKTLKPWMENEASATTVTILNKGRFSKAPFPLAPLDEQTRIADKLDTLLAHVDSCQAHLARVPQLLKRFRQSVLAAATSGRLTEGWREENSIVDDWQETDVQSVAIVGTGSTPLRSNPGFYSPKGTPWVTSAATGQPFITSAQEFVTDEAIKAHRLKLFPVGTLVIAMYGEGKTRGQVSELAIEATTNQACAAIIVDETKILKNYVKLALQANYLEMREMAEGGNQPNLNLSKIKEFPLPLPSLPEQHEIVRRVEALFAMADRLEARWRAAQGRVGSLTPSLLAKAFRGELVPQDAGDESAVGLLERIRQIREKG